jgi:hypothetical protein
MLREVPSDDLMVVERGTRFGVSVYEEERKWDWWKPRPTGESRYRNYHYAIELNGSTPLHEVN